MFSHRMYTGKCPKRRRYYFGQTINIDLSSIHLINNDDKTSDVNSKDLSNVDSYDHSNTSNTNDTRNTCNIGNTSSNGIDSNNDDQNRNKQVIDPDDLLEFDETYGVVPRGMLEKWR